MTTETEVSTGAETEIVAPEVAENTESAPEQLEQETPEVAESEEDKASKAAKALQRRLDKRTRDYYQAQAERDQLRAEIEALRQKPEEREQVDVESVARTKAEEILKERELASKVNALMSKGKSIEGFNEAANAVVEELGLLDSKGRPTQSLHVILESDSPAELIAHIGSDPDILESLNGLTPTQLARRLARIENEMQAKPKTSNAPKPLAPVKPAAVATQKADHEMSDAEWYRLQRKRT